MAMDDQDYSAWNEFINYPGSPPPDATTDSASDLATPNLVSPTTDPSPTESWTSARTPSPPEGGGYRAPGSMPAVSGNYFDDAMPQPVTNTKKRPSRAETGLSMFLPAAKKRVGTGLSVLIPRKKSQRAKKVETGFPCRVAGCGKMHDRKCDEKKHYERKHMEQEGWPHECTRCDKRCHYPKDVWRHLEQTHHMNVPPKEPKSIRKELGCPCCNKDASAWLQANNATGPIETSFPLATPMDSGPSSPKPGALLRALTQSIMSFRKLSLKGKGIDEKFIMVSTDKKNFVEVDVTKIKTANTLIRDIRSVLRLAPDAQIVSVQNCKRSVSNMKITRGEPLMELVENAADADGTLKLFIETRRPAPVAFTGTAASDPHSMMRS